MPSHPSIVVVGSPSLDRVGSGAEQRLSVGGAAFLTALAARRAGAEVGLLARVPAALPAEVAEAFAPGMLDHGGLVEDEDGLPGFEIHYDAEGRASYRGMRAGAEARVTIADLPEAWLAARVVHLSPLAGRTDLQLRALADLRARGFGGLVSAGTFLRAVHGEPGRVRALAAGVDLFFCNREEADVLWGTAPPATAARVCVSDGPRAVTLWEEGRAQRRPVPEARVLDPTGAGDALCGGFLAGLVLGVDPLARGLAQARAVLGDLGGRALLRRRAVLDPARILRLGPRVAAAAATAALPFCGFPFPEAHDPHAADLLAAATLHQYGFWYADERGWTGPMWARATPGGRRWKGSDFVWQGFTRAVAEDPTVLEPARVASEPDLIHRILADEHGRCPLPDLEGHRRLHQAWGLALPPEGFGPLLATANASTTPGRTLLQILAAMPGYAEDPLQKKAILLALILARRPERLLDLRDPESLGPIVDYHLMRGCLRTGCVRVDDEELRARLAARAWVTAEQEEEVREACWHALRALCAASSRSVAEVDGFFFALGRAGCGEEALPACDACAIAADCARAVGLFQPIHRTTAY
ncbi:MAG: PfkB family carbohydrate kinase [Pseudomonadota bacterium]